MSPKTRYPKYLKTDEHIVRADVENDPVVSADDAEAPGRREDLGGVAVRRSEVDGLVGEVLVVPVRRSDTGVRTGGLDLWSTVFRWCRGPPGRVGH